MKAYLITTGVLFALITLVHIWRAIEERPNLASEPWYLVMTAVAAVLCVWAFVLLRRESKSRSPF
jgi:uncharacterized membrane protein